MSKNLRVLSHKGSHQRILFSSLSEAMEGNLPADEVCTSLGEETLTSPAIIRGTASFYDFLDSGTNTYVCHGTACLVGGSTAELSANYPEAGRAMCCGYCYRGGGLLQRDGNGQINGYSAGSDGASQPGMPVYNPSGQGVLTKTAEDVPALYGVVLEAGERIQAELERSQLRGRGGAGFPFFFKLKAVAEAEAEGAEKYIVCNADEGDPGAFSDRYLLEQQPHKVLAGMYAAGLCSGAKEGILYIRHEYPAAIERMARAIEEYLQLEPKIHRRFRFRIVKGAGSYVCGEETALLNSIEGLRPEVRVRPPYPATHGLWGRPTLVSNVETFANIPWILVHGGEAYADLGTAGSKGTKLLSLDSQFVRPGLYEVEFGMPLKELVFDHAGGFSTGVKALQVGGPLGSIVPLGEVERLTIDFEDFQQRGFALGHAGMIVIPDAFPMIDFMRHIFAYMADESCGKCTPCRLGTAKGARMLETASPDAPLDRRMFDELLELLEVGSLCALGGGLPLPMRNAMEHFREELLPFFADAVEGR